MSNNDTNRTQSRRGVQRKGKGVATSDGAGVNLIRHLPFRGTLQLDPFLLLDVIQSDNPEEYIAGFPPHPHRGFETVTYLLNGRVRHRDSAGHEGVLRAGGVQWMTAGSGIEHSEIPEQESGLLFGFQLWVNLPAAEKMQLPKYQEFEPEEIPIELRNGNQRIHVIAGSTSLGTQGPIRDISAKPLFFDLELPVGTGFKEMIPSRHTAFIYVIEGSGEIVSETEATALETGDLAVLSPGNTMQLNASTDLRALLIAGQPFNEPIARQGPFVMNTQEELVEAYRDYAAGRFGHVEAA